jgi:hypothetical protein
MLHDSLTFLLPLCGQIWLSALLDHSQPNYLTNLKKGKEKLKLVQPFSLHGPQIGGRTKIPLNHQRKNYSHFALDLHYCHAKASLHGTLQSTLLLIKVVHSKLYQPICQDC